MKNFLSGLWRLIKCGIIGLIFFIALDVTIWFFPPHRGISFWQWDACGPVAVGENYSVIFLTRKAHLFLAEYDQQIEVYEGTEREGKRKGNLSLHMNTGGRTDVKLLTGTFNEQRCVQIVDRFGTETVNLKLLEIIQIQSIDNSKEITKANFKEIGTFSGESYPLKFIPKN